MRGTLDINRESNIHAAARTMQTPISIHALHEESDTTANVMLRMLKFQSTLSMRRATLRGHVDRVVQPISIHALHEESDLCSYPSPSAVAISIHALHEESDRVHTTFDSKVLSLFQSTLSMRRATGQVTLPVSIDLISIHALHEESDESALRDSIPRSAISIHALHEESDHTAIR